MHVYLIKCSSLILFIPSITSPRPLNGIAWHSLHFNFCFATTIHFTIHCQYVRSEATLFTFHSYVNPRGFVATYSSFYNNIIPSGFFTSLIMRYYLHYSLFTIHYSLFVIHSSLFTFMSPLRVLLLLIPPFIIMSSLRDFLLP